MEYQTWNNFDILNADGKRIGCIYNGRVWGSKGERRDAMLCDDGVFRNHKNKIVGYFENGEVLSKRRKPIGTTAEFTSLNRPDASSTFDVVFNYIEHHRSRMLVLYAVFVIVGMIAHYFMGTSMGDAYYFLLFPALIGIVLYRYRPEFCFIYCLGSLFLLAIWSLMNYAQGWDVVGSFFLPRLGAILTLLAVSAAD